MHEQKLFRLVSVGSVLALVLGLSASALAEEDEVLSADALSTEHLTFISQSGTEIVAHLDKARADLDRNDWTRAHWETGKARAILGRVREKSPSLRIQDRIAAALKELRSVAKPKRETLLPIYAELDAAQSTMDVADVRTFVDKAGAGADRGEVETVEDNLLEASTRVRFLEIDLPIEETYSRLTRALIELRNKDLLAAKATLREAQQHIQSFVQIASRSMEEDTSDVSAGPE